LENSSFYKDLPKPTKNVMSNGDLIMFNERDDDDFNDMKDPNFFKHKSLAEANKEKEEKDLISIHDEKVKAQEGDFLSDNESLFEHKVRNPDVYKQTVIAKFLKR